MPLDLFGHEIALFTEHVPVSLSDSEPCYLIVAFVDEHRLLLEADVVASDYCARWSMQLHLFYFVDFIANEVGTTENKGNLYDFLQLLINDGLLLIPSWLEGLHD